MKILREIEAKKLRLLRRKKRIRKKIFGTTERPRISIYRSNKHFYAQLINDEISHTILSASTLSKELKGKLNGLTKTEQARIVGTLLAEKMLKMNILKASLDRNGRKYHGRIKAFADALREKGIQI